MFKLCQHDRQFLCTHNITLFLILMELLLLYSCVSHEHVSAHRGCLICTTRRVNVVSYMRSICKEITHAPNGETSFEIHFLTFRSPNMVLYRRCYVLHNNICHVIYTRNDKASYISNKSNKKMLVIFQSDLVMLVSNRHLWRCCPYSFSLDRVPKALKRRRQENWHLFSE